MEIKIKIFMWYMFKGVILTKDNLARRNWNRIMRSFFFTNNGTMHHLFFECHFGKFLWRLVHISFGLKHPNNTSHISWNWLVGIDSKIKEHIMVGASTICWALWLSRNGMVFDNSIMKSYMQVLFNTTY